MPAHRDLENHFFVMTLSSSAFSSALHQPWLPGLAGLPLQLLLTRSVSHVPMPPWSVFGYQLYQQSLPNCGIKTTPFATLCALTPGILHALGSLVLCLNFLSLLLASELGRKLGLSPITSNTTLVQFLRIEIMELFLLPLIIHIKYIIISLN